MKNWIKLSLFACGLTASAQAFAECAEWNTQCTNTCVSRDEYGSCTQTTQSCTQVCVRYTQNHEFFSEVAQEKHFFEAVKVYPKDAKSIKWRVVNDKVEITEVKQ